MTEVQLNLIIRQANQLLDAAQAELLEAQRLKGQILQDQRQLRSVQPQRDDELLVSLAGDLGKATAVSATEITPTRVDGTQWLFEADSIKKLPASRGNITAPRGIYNPSTDQEFKANDEGGNPIIYKAHRDFHSGRYTIAGARGCDTTPTDCECVDRFNYCAISVEFRNVRDPDTDPTSQLAIGPNNPPTDNGLCGNCDGWNRRWRLFKIFESTNICKFAVGQQGGGFTVEPTAPADACFPCVSNGGNAGMVLTIQCPGGCNWEAQLDFYLPAPNNLPCLVMQYFWEPYDPTIYPRREATYISETIPPSLPSEPCYRPLGRCKDQSVVWPTCVSTVTWSSGQTYQVGDIIRDSQVPARYWEVTGGSGPSSGNDSDLGGGSDPGYTYARLPSHWDAYFDMVNCVHLAQYGNLPVIEATPCGQELPTNPKPCDPCPDVGFRADSRGYSINTGAPTVINPYPGSVDDHGWSLTPSPGAAKIDWQDFSKIKPVTDNVACVYDVLIRYETTAALISSGDVTIIWDAATGKPNDVFALADATGGLDGPHNNTTFLGFNYRKIGEVTHDGLTNLTIEIQGDGGGGAATVRFDDLVFRRQ